jgi:peptide/nickel transport system substrate-binding protein
VVFHFSRVFSPALYDIVKQNIVPQHIWKDVANPVTYTNDNPVGSGPFTQVATFQNQVYEVDKNPYYWQSGKPAYKGIRVQAYSSNDQETLALDNGQVDWAGNFIPNIKQALIDKNPNMHYWSPTTGLVALMELNTTKKPYNDVNMRKAISMALDRQHMVDVAISGYTKPADVTGLSDGFAKWKVSDLSQLGDWTTYNVAKANQLLDSAGYKKGADGYRTFPDGSPMTLNLTMVNGFSDWISAGNIMVPNLKAVGLNVQVKTINPSVLFDIEPKGQFDMALWFGFQTATPFTFYQNVMSKATVVPVGQVTFTNFGRYSSAAADALLDQFASTTDASRQLQLGYQLQKVFADEAPVIPLWPAPDYCEYSTAHFTGWPSADNPYATCQPQGNTSPQQLIVLTTIKPV